MKFGIRTFFLVNIIYLCLNVAKAIISHQYNDSPNKSREDYAKTNSHTFSPNTPISQIKNLKHKTEAINSQYIVQFKGYYKKETREKYIKAALRLAGVRKWKVVVRDNRLLRFPSDFDVIQIDKLLKDGLNALENHPLVRRVTPDKLIYRNLKYTVSNEGNYSNNSTFQKDYNEKHNLFLQQPSNHKTRKLLRAIPRQISKALGAEKLWEMGFTGKGVRVAIFDTGLAANHPHFKRIKERTNWTKEKTLDDGVGHGTFVAGVIASSYSECLGLAPDAELYIFRVFTNAQVSYTSWFLDAFNYAIFSKISVLNLSIGGPDFMDQPFVDKVWELTANGIIMVSAIGNDGPLYGTLNNPADQLDVIGVGGINWENQIAKFSSRGMTTWELPSGYGRVKPDLVTYGTGVSGSALSSGCRFLSGTSVASPVVAGAVALLASAFIKPNKTSSDWKRITPASMKQALTVTARRLPGIGIFEQGAGSLDLLKAFHYLNTYSPRITLSPSYIDLTECQYMWPYCTQAIYYSEMPTIVNVTITNGFEVSGKISDVSWHPYVPNDGLERINVAVEYSHNLWPWSGWLAVIIMVSESSKNWQGIIQGIIKFTVESQSNNQEAKKMATIKLPLKAKIIPTPPRHKRILWDQYHNLRYPNGYFPRDDLKAKNDPLDWNGDHIHTNFKDMYQHLRNAGYYLEVLGVPFTCFKAKYYGALLIVDTEEEFFPDEITKIKKDVEEGLSLIVFAEWYNVTIMRQIKFFDENTQQWWVPLTGGANVPALNDLMYKNWGIALGDDVRNGRFTLGEQPPVNFASGTVIYRFPKEGFVFHAELQDQGQELLSGKESKKASLVPILGFLQTDNKKISDKNVSLNNSGRIVVYGDSNCIDYNDKYKPCFWMLDAILEYVSIGHVPTVFVEKENENRKKISDLIHLRMLDLPLRMKGNNLRVHSKVLEPSQVSLHYRPLPSCPALSSINSEPLNETVPIFQPNFETFVSIPDLETDIPAAIEVDPFWNQKRFGKIIIGTKDIYNKNSQNNAKLQKKFYLQSNYTSIIFVLLFLGFIALSSCFYYTCIKRSSRNIITTNVKRVRTVAIRKILNL